ncbi:MAG: hypothetical protein CFE25_18100 [Chitinophagaceae bacterium BSSC1]|nr:MAG: hypothetical protein CFE25_18100 [Chitinophagaceae bacterium BSSC1]
MQFLNPIWLWSALGVIIPIAIHLWNQQPGKVLEVGSIRFMDPSPSKRSSRLQLTEIWLLILRCLIILLLSLFLAQPIWNSNTQQSNQGWVMVPRSSMKMAYQMHQKSIDSLLQQGMELHALEPGFPALDLKSDSSKPNSSEPVPNLWALASLLEKQVPANYQLHLYTPELLQYYRGVKPILHRSMVWKTYSMPTQVDTGINKRKQNIRIAVLADDYAADADYLLAVCKAIQMVRGDTILVAKFNNPTQIPDGQDWLFWLSDKPLPKNNSKHTWSYQLGNEQIVQTQIYASTVSLQEKIPLYKTIPMQLKGELIWEDGFGQAVLQKRGNGQYLMNTRFHPDWNGLVWSPAFPSLMQEFLLGSKPFDPSHLAMDPVQILPEQHIQNQGQNSPTVSTSQQPLSHWIWGLLLVFLIIERVIVFYQTKNKTHG